MTTGTSQSWIETYWYKYSGYPGFFLYPAGRKQDMQSGYYPLFLKPRNLAKFAAGPEILYR